MPVERLPRRLVAILCADVVGYSRMSEIDEESTFLKVREYLDYFAVTIKGHHGRVIKYSGDAVLAVFNSAADALICAAQVQAELKKRNKSLADDRKVCFRIGLNLGDVIQDRGDVFGDGVNVAARLEALGQAEGICVAGSFYDAVVMKLPFDFEFMGEQQVKNITKPIQAYHVKLQKGAELPETYKKDISTKKENKRKLKLSIVSFIAAIFIFYGWILWPFTNTHISNDNELLQVVNGSLMDKRLPTIIVLPFANMSSDAEQEIFADGITEDIITDLSRISNLHVLARNTSFRFKGKIVDPLKIGKELKVTHLLEGSVRKSGNQLRINAQLIETNKGRHIWAARYDRELIDVFAVQDDVTRNIVHALAVKLTAQDKKSLAHHSSNNIEAYKLFLQGQRLLFQEESEFNLQAQTAFRQAIKLDSQYARAYGALAVAMTFSVNYGWSDSPAQIRARALELARKAILLDNKSQHVFWSLGFVHLYRNEYILASAAVKTAIKLAPSFADGYTLLALIENNLGNPEISIKLINKAMLLNPYYTWEYPYNLGYANYSLGHYKRSIALLQDSLNRNPNARQPRLFLISSYMGLGMQDEAEWEVNEIITQYPNITLSYIENESGASKNEFIKKHIEHLRLAGIPE